MRSYLLAVTLLLCSMLFFTTGIASAKNNNQVTGSLSAENSIISIKQFATLTCTYNSTQGLPGKGTLEISGPSPTSAGPFNSWSQICEWDTLASGVPVTFNQQLNQTGYYQFRWLCTGGCVDGAYTVVTVQVVDIPEQLPEASSSLGLLVGFAALTVFVAKNHRRH